MLIAVLTDLHANREALSACLEHAALEGANQYVFLGDLVGYGGDPAWVMDTVMSFVQRGALAVVGNHDQAVLHTEQDDMNATAMQAVHWTRAQMRPEHLQFIAALPYTLEYQHCLFAHANAWAPKKWGYIDSVLEATRSMMACQAQISFCGHVHMPTLYHMTPTGKTGEFLPTPEHGIPLSPQRRWLVIPGSAGQPRDGNPAACYASFNTVTQELKYHRIPYDAESAAKKVRAAGLPESLAQRLLTGA